MGNYIKAGILAGIVLFVWSFISWTMLPWHMASVRQFNSEVAVAQIVQANVAESGVYMLPAASTAQGATAQNQPVVFASVIMGGMPMSMAMQMGISLATQIIAAFIVAWMLSRTYRLSYIGRVAFVFAFAVAATIIRDVPLWTWFGFDLHYTLVNMADVLVGWLLAGLVLAKCVRQHHA